MATTSFSESFKYGSRLFGFVLGLLVVGGGMIGGGAYLAVPEIQAWRSSGSAETAFIAGGLILVTLGLSILIIGQYAIIYKLIADGVARGTGKPAVDVDGGPDPAEQSDEPAETGEEAEPEPPVEQEPVAEATEEPTESAEQQAPAPQQEPTQPAAEAEPPAQATEGQPPAQNQQDADREPEQPPQQEPTEQPGREQTAEEIVFGSSETEGEEQTDTEDEDTGEFEFDEEDEKSRDSVETAGNPSSDPLADNFDDE